MEKNEIKWYLLTVLFGNEKRGGIKPTFKRLLNSMRERKFGFMRKMLHDDTLNINM